MKAIGKTIKCMEKVFLNGLMEESIKESMFKTKNMVLEEFNGLMEKYIKDNGNKECSMDKVNTKEEMGYGDKVIGKMGKELDD